MNGNRNHKGIELLLENYNKLKTNIDNMKTELQEIAKESGLKAITYEQESVSKTNKITSITEDTAIRNIEYSDLLERRLDITESKLRRIDNSLNQLNDLEREIIERKDIKNEAWYIITSELPCVERTARRIRKRALDKLVICMYGIPYAEYLKSELAYNSI